MNSRAKSARQQPRGGSRQRTTASAVPPAAQPDRLLEVAAGGVLVLITLATYVLLCRAGFIWDDDSYVETNTTLRSADGLLRMWLDSSALHQYYPLVHTTFWFEYQLWGLNPLGFHVVNVLLHATSVVLLWRLLERLRLPGAWLAAAIFAVHPVEVESVAWVTERKNVLSLALALGALLCYLRFSPVGEVDGRAAPIPGRWRWYALSLLLFAGALLSKTVVASLPAVLLVLFWWQRGRIREADLWPLVPFFLLGIALGLHTAVLERHNVGAVGREWDFSVFQRLLIAGRAAWFYAAKLCWPDPLVFVYPRWHVDAREWWQGVFPCAAVALLAALWLARGRIGRGPLAAALIFVGVLVPALGFFNVYPFRYSFVADHFQYHASIALVALAATGLWRGAMMFPRGGRIAGGVCAGAALVLLAALSVRQTMIYEGVEPLFRHSIAMNPTGWMAHSNLGVELEKRGRLDEAFDLFREAVRLYPEDSTLQNNMGHILLSLGERDGFKPGQIDEMTSYFRRALELKPNSIPAGRGMGFALYHAKRYDASIEQFARTLNLESGDPYSLCGMGAVFCAAGKLTQADGCFQQAIHNDPRMVEAYRGLSMVRIAQGRVDDAIAYLRETLRIQPNHAEAHFELGNLLAQKKDFAHARDEFATVVKLRPDYIEAWNRLGIASGEIGQVDAAIDSFREMLRLDPDSVAAKGNLEQALGLKQNQGLPK